ncbi:MAG TPA: purine-nucleoside phosphorylase [Bacteroidota bacterium]|nr:purine-nucleoside phosphorylase [Bacteroidota bacterium]
MNTLLRQVSASVAYIREHCSNPADVALILGSGLGAFADSLPFPQVVPTSAIPHYPRSGVEGHRGRLVFASVEGKNLLAFQGRVHFYETSSLEATLFPIHVAHSLGVRTLIVTNAAGGINRGFSPGDLMLITDQINLTGENALSGPNGASVHHSYYSESLIHLACNAAESAKIPLRSGVYAGLKGPTYETAAEVEMVYRLGGDAAGMSTVLEVGLAASLGMQVLGISCITNHATGISATRLSHAEVTEVGNRVKTTFAALLTEIIRRV